MPCATPPCTWPRTISGFTRLADVVDHDVAQRPAIDAGLGVDLDLGDVAAVGEGVRLDLGHLGGVQRGHVLALAPARCRWVAASVRMSDAAVGADDGEAPARSNSMSAAAASSCLGGRLLALLDHACRRSPGSPGPRSTGCARRRCRRRSGSCRCRPASMRIFSHRHAEPIDGELDIGGLVALAGGLRADVAHRRSRHRRSGSRRARSARRRSPRGSTPGRCRAACRASPPPPGAPAKPAQSASSARRRARCAKSPLS